MNDAALPPLAERLQALRQLLLGDDETPLDPPPSVIFVGGAARTGTTLLQNVLCSSSVAIPVIAEAAPVRFLLESHRLTGNHTRVHTGAYFASQDSLDDYYRGVLDSLFAHLRELHACRVLVLKEPELTKHFFELMRLVPQACFVVAVRDPRDVVTSMLDWGERSRREGRSHLFQQRDMAALAEFYLAFYWRFWTDFPRELLARLRFVRYEDLVHDPLGMGRRLQRYTGVPLADYDPTREWRHVKLGLDQRTSPIRDALTEHYGKPVTEAKVGAWREALSETEAAEVMQICRPIRVAFNYRPYNAGHGVILLAFDHAPTVELLERRCAVCGYASERLAVHESPAAALARVRAAGRSPAAVIIDAVRGQSGVEQIESLRALGDLTPAVVCMPPSWVARAMDRVERIAACAHVVKPIKMRALEAALQAARGAATASSTAGSVAHATSTRTRRILLVEDNADNRLLIKAYLKQRPYDIVEAENGVQAVAYIQAQEFDLVLMDVQMPVMDGYAATAAIRAWESSAERARLPIIALTANAIKEDYLASLAAGCDDHLTKPIKKQTLLAALDARFA